MKLRSILLAIQSAVLAGPAAGLDFSHRIATTLSPQLLWTYLEDALSGPDKAGLWPKHLSKIHGSVSEGGELEEVIFKTATFRFRISELQPGKGFRYSPIEGQTLRGRSFVEIEPRGTGSMLIWQGRYEIGALSPQRISFRLYEALFFGSLRYRIKQLESATR